MAAASSPFASSKEMTNYARLCRLLVDLGSKALRDTFDKVHPPSTLEERLLTHKPTLQPLYAGFIGKRKVKKVLYPSQWGKLYPVRSPVTSASFDITLLTVLLRKICGFGAPAKGWDNLPPSTDTSTADDIARVNYYRNTVYGHANQASVDDASFNAYWSEIREVLVRLGGTSFRGYINNLEHDTMNPDMEEHYREVMKQWKKDEDSIKEKLEEMEELPPESEEEYEEAIMEQPSSQKIKEGLNVELVFKCKARGNSKLTYQWYKDGNMLQGGDEGTLALKSVTLLDFGCYKCVASYEDSSCLSLASSPAELDVTPRDGTEF